MYRRSVLLIPSCLLLLLTACPKDKTPVTEPTADPTKSAATKPKPDPKPDADDPDPNEDDGPSDSELMPIDRTCTSDDECRISRVSIGGNHECCWKCGADAVSATWQDKTQKYCGDHRPAGCPRYRCQIIEYEAVCKSGKCEKVEVKPE